MVIDPVYSIVFASHQLPDGPTARSVRSLGANSGPSAPDPRVTGTTGIAAALNARGVPAARGGQWRAIQVRRVLARFS